MRRIIGLRGLAAGGALALLAGMLCWASPAVYASQRPSAASKALGPAVYDYEESTRTIAWTGSSVVIADTDDSSSMASGYGALWYWYQPSGTKGWKRHLVAGSTAEFGYAQPQIAWTGSSVVIAAVDSNGDLDYWWQAAGTKPWHQQVVATAAGGGFYGAPTIAATNRSVVISASYSTGALDYWYQSFGAGNWVGQQVAAASGGYGSPSIAWTGSSVVIADNDDNGNMYYWYQPAGTRPWNPQLVNAASSGGPYASPSIAWTGSSVVIAALGDDGPLGNSNLDYWWQAAGTAPWHPQQVAAGNFSDDFGYEPPSITSTGSSVIIAANDYAYNLNYWYQPFGTTSWTNEEVPGEAIGFNASIAAGTASVVTSTIDSNSSGSCNVGYWYQPFSTTSWNYEQVATNLC